MTRLTNQTYLINRQALRDEWNSVAGGAFVLLSPAEQWSLHEYYRFTERLTQKQLLVHRAALTAACPSLPQRAGKAYAHLRFFAPRLEQYIERTRPLRGKGGKKQLVIFSEVTSELDPQAMAQVLVKIILEQEHRNS